MELGCNKGIFVSDWSKYGSFSTHWDHAVSTLNIDLQIYDLHARYMIDTLKEMEGLSGRLLIVILNMYFHVVLLREISCLFQ